MYENASIANQTQSSPAALANGVAPAYEASETETLTIERLPVQLKLSVGAPNDPLEYEADAMADKVMRMPESLFIQRKSRYENNNTDHQSSFIQRCSCGGRDDDHVQLKSLPQHHISFIQRCACNGQDDERAQLKPMSHVSSFIQRKSSCSCGDYDDEHIHLKPLVNQITPFVQAKGDGGTTVSDSVSSQIRSTIGGGNSMQSSTKSFMENRFGTDFSDVKIHTGSESAQLSQTLNAKAFTVSNNIYFNNGQYQPDTSSGKHLLAHELTHVVQQGSTTAQNVQRAVSPKMGEIRDRLTYGIIDWAITDSNVHDVLVDLQPPLNPQDLKDTVAVMEKEGLVTRLYDNLAESDEKTQPFVEGLMQQVQNARFLVKGKRTSCTEKQTQKYSAALGKIKDWANAVIDAIIKFEVGITPEATRIGALLDKYFFHEAQTGILTSTQRVSYARQIAQRVKTMMDGADKANVECPSPFDLMCRGSGHVIAYADRDVTPHALRTCDLFYTKSADSSIATIFHELMHYYFADIGDTGYRHERVFEFLSPNRAILNADSYSMFATEIMLGERAAANELRKPADADRVRGCNQQQERTIRRDIAYASRMIQNAINIIDGNYTAQNQGNFASNNFHSTKHEDLVPFVQRFHTVHDGIPNTISFHCDVTSVRTTDALPFIDGIELTLTKPYFDIISDNDRIANLIAILFRRYSTGMTAAIWPSAPAYATQTLNQAYTNPAAYTSYAQDMSFHSADWDFADAAIRNREEISRVGEMMRTMFIETYDDFEFQSQITTPVIISFMTPLRAPHITDTQLESSITTLSQKISLVRTFTDRIFLDYNRVNNDNFFAGLMGFDGTIFSESRLFSVFDTMYHNALVELKNSFQWVIQQVNNGVAIKFVDWVDYPTLLTKYKTESQKALGIMLTYKDYLKKLHAAKAKFGVSDEKLLNSKEVTSLPFFESIDKRLKLMLSDAAFTNEISKIEDSIAIAVLAGKRFNPKSRDFPVSETLLRQFESQLRKIVPPSKLRVRKKLSVGAVNDPLEYEADAMADKVMKMPDDQTIQRKSSCSCNDYDDEHVHLKPLVNQVTSFIQAKADEGATVSDSVSSQIKSTKGSGNAMQGSTKSFMENRFGTDFSDVKIHSGIESAQLSQELNAKAFTASNNIYFNSGQYQPDTSSGKHLLAHELTHVVQQGSTNGQDVQRKVSPKIDEIKDRLTYGIIDWAITDSNVHDVLVDLQALNPQDLRDTVAVMEKEGLVTRLYDNLAESDDRTKPFVPNLMQQVQDARFLKGGGNGSCNAKQTAQSGTALGKIKEWASGTIDAVNDFEIGIDPVKSARIGKLLDKYFFHEAQTGVLSPAQRTNFARLIISRIKTMGDKAAGTIINCASPFDLTCSGGNAIAYVSRGNPSVLRVCGIFFGDSAGSQIATTFHELMHFYNPQVDDTGYRHERIFEYLPPDRAVNNADSYSTFATEIMLGEKAAAQELRSGRDSVQGCNPQQETNLRRDIAYVTRMIQNSVNQLDDSYAVQNSGNFASVNFHSTNHQDLIKFVERFHKVQNSVPNRIPFHCNVGSAQTTDALPFIDNSGLALTQPYFNIASENNRIATLFAILFRKYSNGMTAAIWPSAPAYATQTLNQAYTNPAAYASYAQGISFNSSAWNFADAGVRYGEEIQRTLERISFEFNERYDDSGFKSHIIDGVTAFLANKFTAVHFISHAQLDTGTTTLLQKINIIRGLLDRMYHDYISVNNDNFFTGLKTFDGSIFSESGLFRVFDLSYHHALTDLSNSFSPILIRIDNGEAIKFEDWTDYPALLTKYQTESRNTISVMSTYKNYLKKLYASKESYNKSSEKLKNSPEVTGLSFGESIVAQIGFFANNAEFGDKISKINDAITIEVMHGRRFNPRNPDLPASENLLRQFESQLRKIVPPSKLRVHKKLAEGAVNNTLEYEADAMDDKVMKMPDDQMIQLKASCSCYDYDDEHVHLKPIA